MATSRQIAANRMNAQRSTGPRTPDGKAKARLNALRHGLCAQETLLADEDVTELEDLASRLRDQFRPEGELENLWFDRAVAALWRLRRLARVEAGLFTSILASEKAAAAERDAMRYVRRPLEEAKEHAERAGWQVMNPEQYLQAETRRREAEDLENSESAAWGRAFIHDAAGTDSFVRLARYETTIERSFLRALEQLEHAQAMRSRKDSARADEDGR